MVRAPKTQVEPDVLVFPAGIRAGAHWREVHEHWLAVEVLSPSSRVYDREFKRDAYLALGVRHVWLIDSRERSVEVCRGVGESEIVRDVVRWRVPGTEMHVSIDLHEIFAGL